VDKYAKWKLTYRRCPVRELAVTFNCLFGKTVKYMFEVTC